MNITINIFLFTLVRLRYVDMTARANFQFPSWQTTRVSGVSKDTGTLQYIATMQ